MITFKQFIAERDSTEEEDADFNTLVEMIKKDCAPFLQAIDGAGFLYRGVQTNSGRNVLNSIVYYEKKVRTDRKPLSTEPRLSKIVDDWFEKKFGFRARQETMFARGENAQLSSLQGYGTPCVVFPIGSFEFVWSEKVFDLYTNLYIPSNVTGTENITAAAEKFLEDAEFKSTGMDDAVQSRMEVLVKCPSYYAVPLQYREQLKRALLS